MEEVAGIASGQPKRVYRTLSDKRRIVELSLLPGASVSRLARAEGVNSHQIFNWRRAYHEGRLGQREPEASALLPVILPERESSADADLSACVKLANIEPSLAHSTEDVAQEAETGAIHIEFPGRARISLEGRVSLELARTVLELLRP